MKKLIITALLLMGSTIITKAHQEESLRFKVELSVRNDKPVYGGIPVPKSPVIPPDVWLDDHTLYIDSIGCDCTVQLTDASNVVVCSVFVPDGTTVVQLPSTLSGTYELSIIPDSGSYYWAAAARRRCGACRSACSSPS